MNPHILFVIDHKVRPDKYTKEQLKQNSADAYALALFDLDVDYVAVNAAAYFAANAAVCAAANAAWTADIMYWLNQYFKSSGEDRQDYINALRV